MTREYYSFKGENFFVNREYRRVYGGFRVVAPSMPDGRLNFERNCKICRRKEIANVCLIKMMYLTKRIELTQLINLKWGVSTRSRFHRLLAFAGYQSLTRALTTLKSDPFSLHVITISVRVY